MRVLAALLTFAISGSASGQELPLIGKSATHELAQEISGDVAMRNLEEIARHHRMRGSRGFRAATDHLGAQLERYGLSSIEVLRFPADGEILYGTQRSRRPWNVESAELWEVRSDGEVRIASWQTMPMRLAQDSESGSAVAEVVDVGAGVAESDYAGREIEGKLVLTSSQPAAVAPLAFGRHGAAGILSYAQNQRTGWYGENETLVRWGHLDTFSSHPGFAFMLSLQEARRLQQRLAVGERITMRAEVRAGQEAGAYEILTATIPGSDPQLSREEIVYSCHLDHPRPGANDNASGCAAILEVARTLNELISDERIPRPARTIRFVWPPEIEGTMAFLVGRPEIASRIRAAVHLDMVGGGPETKAMFHVTRGPASLPSFAYDLAQEIGRWVNEQTATFAMTGSADYPLLAAGGGKEPLRAEMVDFTIGSDHQIYSDSSFGIPAVYLNDWPDRYIHTHLDTPANIDPTKLGRAAFIAAATGYALAQFSSGDKEAVLEILQRGALRRRASLMERRQSRDSAEAANLARFQSWYERELVQSIERFASLTEREKQESEVFLRSLPVAGLRSVPARGDEAAQVVYQRNPAVPGPMSVFGYDYFDAHYEGRGSELALLQIRGGRRGSGAEYAYEALNLVDGTRSVADIRDALSAIYEPVPLGAVAEYLRALESIGVIAKAPNPTSSR